MSILKRVCRVSLTSRLTAFVRNVSSAQTGAAAVAVADEQAANLQTTVELNDGNKIPILGLGTYEANGSECTAAVRLGYRLLDTATCYTNEDNIGTALRQAGVRREDVIITTKVWEPDHGKTKTLKSFAESLERLGIGYIDLYLIHSPAGGKILETWDAMLELQSQGLIRSVGVSNFNIHHLEKLLAARPSVVPVVNQIELSPYCTREQLVAYCQANNITIQAYSPLTKGQRLSSPSLVAMANKYSKTPAQLLIRWSLQKGYVCIPKTVHEDRMIENADVFDFNITHQDMDEMSSWNEDLVTDWPGVDILSTPWLP